MAFDTLSTARAVILGTETQFSGTVHSANPLDYYRIQVEGRSSLRVSLTGLSGNANLEIVRDLNRNGAIDSSEILHRSSNGSAIAEVLNPILDAGTYFVRVAATTDSTNYQLSILVSTNSRNELVWRNTRTGENGLWLMHGTSVLFATGFTGAPDLNWQISGTGDFNQDGHADLVWRNTRTGENGLWFLNGTTVLSMIAFRGAPDLNWQIGGTGDFNQDGYTDLVWRNLQTGENGLWLMQGTTVLSTTLFMRAPDVNWRMVGTGDFNQDGQTDLVWRNTRTGENGLWLMQGTSVLSTTQFLQADLNWQIVGIGDFGSGSSMLGGVPDRRPDLVWRNTQTGAIGLWFMQGATVLSTQTLTNTPSSDLNWQLVGTRRHFNEPFPWDGGDTDRVRAFNIGTLNGAGSFRDRLGAFDSDDFYQFNLTETSAITLQLLEPTASFQLLDANGNVLQTSGSNRFIASRLNSGTYFVRVFQATASEGAYSLAVSGVATPIHRYEFVYYYNGRDNTADYYTGSVFALANTYDIHQFYDVNPAHNETGNNGWYYITGSRVEGTIADLGKVFVNTYYDVDSSGARFTPNKFRQSTHAGSHYLGSETDTIGLAGDNFDSFGGDQIEADIRSISAVSIASSLRLGMPAVITWNDTINENVKIDVLKGGVFLWTLASSTLSDGSHDWIPSNFTVANDYQIRITSVLDGTIFAMSNLFALTSPGTIRVTNPNGGNLLRPGSSLNLTWTDDIRENVSIELYKGNALHTTIATSTESDGTHSWTLPTLIPLGTDFRIRIASVLNALVVDWSDAFFTIQDLFDPGSTLNQAESQNSASFSRSQQVSASDREDFYRFNVSQSGIFTANLTGLTGDADVQLIQDVNNNGIVDPGEVLAWQWERNTASESIRRFLNAGTYFLRVLSYRDQTANYFLTTNFTAATSDDRRFAIQINFVAGSEFLSNAMRNAVMNAASFWQNVISHSSGNRNHTLTIDVGGQVQEWGQRRVLASAGYRLLDSHHRLPIAGVSTINTHPDAVTNLSSDLEYFTRVMIHEFGHVLGLGTLWSGLINTMTSLYNANTYAGWAYGELLGRYEQVAIPLTFGVGSGSDHSHWREEIFDHEIMTHQADRNWLGGANMPLSQLTIAALRDIGWNVNYGAAEAYTLPSPGLQSSTSPSSISSEFAVVCGCAQHLAAARLTTIGSSNLANMLGIPETV